MFNGPLTQPQNVICEQNKRDHMFPRGAWHNGWILQISLLAGKQDFVCKSQISAVCPDSSSSFTLFLPKDEPSHSHSICHAICNPMCSLYSLTSIQCASLLSGFWYNAVGVWLPFLQEAQYLRHRRNTGTHLLIICVLGASQFTISKCQSFCALCKWTRGPWALTLCWYDGLSQKI